MLPESFLTSITGSAISDTSSHEILSSASAQARHLISDIDVTNTHASVNTALDILAGGEVLWSIPAPAGDGSLRTFTPPLDCGLGNSVEIQAQDAATILASIRYRKGGR